MSLYFSTFPDCSAEIVFTMSNFKVIHTLWITFQQPVENYDNLWITLLSLWIIAFYPVDNS